MKFPLSWLKTHLETAAPLDEIVRRLVMLGIEVEGVEDRAAALAPFTVARVVSAEPHPNADKLRVCTVDTGGATVQVVCGAPNARAGMKGVFAAVGTTIPRTGTALKSSTIRGVASNGMLCSAYEMGLSDDHEGIIDLPAEAPVGAPFAHVLGLEDPILDVKVTPNRPDCLGVRGIARDLAAAGLGTLKPLATDAVPGKFASPIWVHLAATEPKACPFFVGRLIRGVRNGPSPDWVQKRLVDAGLRPISTLVDITNLMTLDVGRPMHVFDAARLKGDLVVRCARAGETLEALNGRTYTLDTEMTVIADDLEVLSLGGIIGGAPSGVTEATTDVFVEAALFDPLRTAATGRKLNLQSDARYRFERGVDPALVVPGMEIATRLILELCGGEPSELVCAGAVPEWRRTITLRPERVATLGGVEIAPAEIRRILEAVGCTVLEETDGRRSVVPPSFRPDIEGEADLVEEIVRVWGYDRIPAVPMRLETALPRAALDAAQRRAVLVRRGLAERGLTEVTSFSFIDSRDAALFGGGNPALRLANPISADLDEMRPSVLPTLLRAAERNAGRGYADLALFEVGPSYADDTPEGQDLVAAGVRAGRTGPRDWREPARPADAFLAKADALAALQLAGAPVENLQVSRDAPAWYHPGRSGSLRLGKTVLAWFGEVHPRVLLRMGVREPAAAFEVFIDRVPLPRKTGRARPLFRPAPLQPVERDFAFVLDADVAAETLLRAARGVDKALITDVRLFDVYEGGNLPSGKKSLAITVVLQPETASLTDPEIDALSKKVVAAVKQATGGELRG